MSIRIRDRSYLNITTLILLVLGFSSAGAGQVTPADEVAPDSGKTPEEIVVYGQKSVVILRNELYRAEESFFDLFNSLNSNDEFDVDCKKRQGSISQRQKEHRCMPKFAVEFATQASAGFARDMHYGMSRGGAMAGFGDLEYQARVRAMEKKMWAEIVELAKSNPEFLEEIKALQRATLALKTERERRLAAK